MAPTGLSKMPSGQALGMRYQKLGMKLHTFIIVVGGFSESLVAHATKRLKKKEKKREKKEKKRLKLKRCSARHSRYTWIIHV